MSALPLKITREAYATQLREALVVAMPGISVEFRSYGTLRIGGILDAYVEGGNYADVVVAVTVSRWRYGRGNGRGNHRFTNVAFAHVTKQVKRLYEAQAAAKLEQAAYVAASHARTAREEAVQAPIEAMMARVNGSDTAAPLRAWGLSIEEQAQGGTFDYRFGLKLSDLSEAQVLAVLAIAEGAAPEAVALIDSYREVGRRIGTPGQVELIDSYRAQVDARLAAEREAGDR